MQLKTSLVAVTVCAARALGAVIVSGATWNDTSGNTIQAHGGGFLKVKTYLAYKFYHILTAFYIRSGQHSTGSVKTNHIIVAYSKLFHVIQCVLLLDDVLIEISPEPSLAT
jgi:hypothetical protein